MKVAKQLIRNPDGTKSLVRAHKICITAGGKARRVYPSNTATRGYTLPAGARWATEADDVRVADDE